MKSHLKYWYRRLINTPKDKLLHLLAGAIIAGMVVIALPLYIALAAAVLAGAVKEAVDYFGHGTPEWMDFICTSLGGLFVVAVMFLRSIL